MRRNDRQRSGGARYDSERYDEGLSGFGEVTGALGLFAIFGLPFLALLGC